jgi:hypothetical protein
VNGDEDKAAWTFQTAVARGQRCRRARSVHGCRGAASETLFERRGTPIATFRMFVALALQMHLPSLLRSSRDSPSGDGSQYVPEP